ncbi:MAG: AMP-dependent synthetase/ligase [Clostridia bacterium]|nr:AMP-binding protein [Clostridium sp.]
MEKNESRKVYESREVKTYREMIEYSTKNYAKNIAYTYKKDYTAKEIEYVEKTYEQVGKDVKAFSTLLLNKNLEGKRVVLIGNNRYEWCITYFATTTGNMVIVPMDKALPDNEIESLVKRSEAEVAVFDKKYAEVMKKIKKDDSTNLNMLICMDEIEDIEIEKFSDLLNKGNKLVESGDKKYDKIKVNPNEMSIMLFTSGTTNEPKAVMLSQKNICANLTDIACWVKLYPTDRLLSFLPIHHTFECTITFLYGFYSGCTVAFCDGLKYIQKNLAEYKISIFVAVPLVLETMYKKITKAIEEKGKTKLINTMSKISNALLKCKIDLRKVFFKQVLDNFGGNLRLVLYGAAPMNKDTIVGFNNLGIDLVQGYGLTETSPVISAETDKEKRPGSVGLVLPTLEAKIINPDENGEGELAVKGPSVMMGYYKNDEENKKALKDGWFYTGDYAYIDKDGFLFITGRKKDIIVLKNGKNVYPQEIEFLINKLPYVTESLVYQRERSNTDTMLCAKIVYDKDIIKDVLGDKKEEEYKNIIWNEIKEINKTLPVFKHIKNIDITTEPFVKTTTQKVKRYEELKKIGQA